MTTRLAGAARCGRSTFLAMTAANRIVVVHNGRRLLDDTGVSIEIVEQDGGETLKVFITDLPKTERAAAVDRHRERFARSLGREPGNSV